MEIIPAIDIIDGKCVRLKKGDYLRKKIYSADPLELARNFESWGVRRLHLVDLDGAREKKIMNHRVLASISKGTDLIVDFGGGIRSDKDIRIAFENGASMISVGTVAVSEPDMFLKWTCEYGPGKIILGADHRNGIISMNAWSESTGKDIFVFLDKYIKLGINQIICTDIERDGMLTGPSSDLYQKIIDLWPGLYLIASGGISSPEDIKDLDKAGIPAVIIGKAIYEKRITEKDLKPYLN